jgi:transcriptional regulator with XRE-family HTH domain
VTGKDSGLTARRDVITATVARQVRRHRKARGWSLDELAFRSGVSKGMVVQIEGGKTNPSIATLCGLAEAYGVSIAQLVEDDETPGVRVIGATEPPTLWRGPQGGSGRLLCGVSDPVAVELWDWHLAPGERHVSVTHAPGTRELVHVRAGTLTVVVDSIEHRATEGETVDFHSDRPHEYRNDTDASVHLTMVVALKGRSPG